MKRYAIIAAMALASCAGNSDKNNNTADTTSTTNTTPDTTQTTKAPEQAKEYCFVRTEGTKNQDTTKVHLLISGTQVTGEMSWQPKEKDSRKGTLNGKADGDNINAVWSFMQEGMKDSIIIAFKLQPQKLAQKPLKTNTANGHQETDEKAEYSVEYKAVDCGM